MLSTTPIESEGQQIVPIKFLKALLPDPASLYSTYTWKDKYRKALQERKHGKRKHIISIMYVITRSVYKEASDCGNQIYLDQSSGNVWCIDASTGKMDKEGGTYR